MKLKPFIQDLRTILVQNQINHFHVLACKHSSGFRVKSNPAPYLQSLDSQPQHAGSQFGRLLEGEVTPVNDEDEAVDLQLGIFYHRFQ